MKPPMRRTIRLEFGEEPTPIINALIRWFVEDGYKRVSIGRMIPREHSVYVTVSGIE
jgi:hypothetical protein